MTPLHLFCFLGARFFLDTFMPNSPVKPYTALKTRKKDKAKLMWSKIKKSIKGKKIKESKDGEKLWLLDETHVLGSEAEYVG